MKKRRLITGLLIFVLIFAAGCSSSQQTGEASVQSKSETDTADVSDLEPIFSLDEYPACDGSALTLPMSETVCQALTGAERSKVTGKIVHNGKDKALSELFSGKISIVFTEGNEGDLKARAEQAGVSIELFPVAYEYYVFYSAGEKTDADEAGANLTRDEANKIIEGSTETDIKYAKGYFMSGYLTDGVVTYSVDEIEPSAETVKDGQYPYSFYYYAVIRADSPAESKERKIVEALLSESGQKLLEEAGYVKL